MRLLYVVHFFFQLCYDINKEAECWNTRPNNWLGWGIPSELKGTQNPPSAAKPWGGFLLSLIVRVNIS